VRNISIIRVGTFHIVGITAVGSYAGKWISRVFVVMDFLIPASVAVLIEAFEGKYASLSSSQNFLSAM
jgi:hypothetical protein